MLHPTLSSLYLFPTLSWVLAFLTICLATKRSCPLYLMSNKFPQNKLSSDLIRNCPLPSSPTVLAAACGCKVAKAGNRSVSSACGSADVLETLGINIALPAGKVAECIEKCGVGFMFAPINHPAMKQVAPVRKALGVRTVFNILGPLTNAAGAQHVVMRDYLSLRRQFVPNLPPLPSVGHWCIR